MPKSKPSRKGVSKQVRQERQAVARKARTTRRQRIGGAITVMLTMLVVGMLFVFGVVGTRPSGTRKPVTTPSTEFGHVACPRDDGTSPRQTYFNRAPGRCIDATKIYVATIRTTGGTITAELYPSRAFNAVNNFIFLSRYHFYDGLPFHRVLKDTFAQTGDPTAPGVTGPGYEFPDDGLPVFSSEYVPGAILYAHEAKNQNGSQVLFITGPGGATLNPTFPLFGLVKRGLSVLTKINSGASDNANRPAVRYAIQTIDVRIKKT
ncbi:MAG: hypothetical protein QOF21_554 [Actinomycetota bacterium]